MSQDSFDDEHFSAGPSPHLTPLKSMGTATRVRSATLARKSLVSRGKQTPRTAPQVAAASEAPEEKEFDFGSQEVFTHEIEAVIGFDDFSVRSDSRDTELIVSNGREMRSFFVNAPFLSEASQLFRANFAPYTTKKFRFTEEPSDFLQLLQALIPSPYTRDLSPENLPVLAYLSLKYRVDSLHSVVQNYMSIPGVLEGMPRKELCSFIEKIATLGSPRARPFILSLLLEVIVKIFDVKELDAFEAQFPDDVGKELYKKMVHAGRQVLQPQATSHGQAASSPSKDSRAASISSTELKNVEQKSEVRGSKNLAKDEADDYMNPIRKGRSANVLLSESSNSEDMPGPSGSRGLDSRSGGARRRTIRGRSSSNSKTKKKRGNEMDEEEDDIRNSNDEEGGSKFGESDFMYSLKGRSSKQQQQRHIRSLSNTPTAMRRSMRKNK